MEITIENTNTVGTVTISETVIAEAQTGVCISAEVDLSETDMNASASFAEGDKASVTFTLEVSDDTTGCEASAEGMVQSGTFVDVSVQAGTHGIAADTNASIGSSVGVDGSVTESNEYSSTTVGAGASIGEQVSIGGGGEATYSKGVVTVGVSGDVAAIVGIDVDVSTSVSLRKIASDTEKVTHVVADSAKTAGNTVKKESTTTWHKMKKFFNL